MQIRLKNIGKIKETEIIIDGITVIAGYNDTGKSTVGKALYGVFNGLSNISEKSKELLKDNIERKLKEFFDIYILPPFDELGLVIEKFTDELINNKTFYSENEENYKRFFDESINLIKDEQKFLLEDNSNTNNWERRILKRIRNESAHSQTHEELRKDIYRTINISDSDIYNEILQDSLNSEFSYEIANKLVKESESSIELEIKNNCTKIEIVDNFVNNIVDLIQLEKEVVYIDDPHILDDISGSLRFKFSMNLISKGHRRDMAERLVKEDVDMLEKIKAKNLLNEIYKKINYVNHGNLKFTNYGEIEYEDLDLNMKVKITNLSTGLKTFVLIKKLLENGSLEENGTIILDEPEIHLHPEWQLKLAEIIVLIHQLFGMHILLTTHSPYFLRAIEVYSMKYDVTESCNYYLSENTKNGFAEIKNVNDDVDKIYELLANPFDILDEVFD